MGDNPRSALYILIAYIITQIIDNDFLVPKIVASKVKVNALISIVVVLVGGALWGVAGMFLSIPLITIAKVIFDRIESLEAYSFLISVWPETPFSSLCQKNNRSFIPINLSLIF